MEAKAGKIVLVGHSMGTPVIRQYARMYPANVAALVPVDGVLHLSGSPNAPNPERMKGPDGLKNREAMIRGMFGKSATPAIQDHILKMMLAAPETTAYQAMAATFAAPQLDRGYVCRSRSGHLCGSLRLRRSRVLQEDLSQRKHCRSAGHRPLRDAGKTGGVQQASAKFPAQGEFLSTFA